MRKYSRSIPNIFTFLPSAQLNGAVGVNQFSFSIFGRFSEVADINWAICVEFPTIATNLIFLVLGFEDFIIWKDHSINAMGNVGTLSELSQPLRTLFINDLFEFKIVIVEIEGLIDIVEEILDWKRAELFPVLKWFLLFLRIHIWYGH